MAASASHKSYPIRYPSSPSRLHREHSTMIGCLFEKCDHSRTWNGHTLSYERASTDPYATPNHIECKSMAVVPLKSRMTKTNRVTMASTIWSLVEPVLHSDCIARLKNLVSMKIGLLMSIKHGASQWNGAARAITIGNRHTDCPAACREYRS